MNIEKQIYESTASARVGRDDVRRWVIAERKRVDQKFALGSCLLAVLFVGFSAFLYRTIDSEMKQVKQMVHLPRSAAMVTLEEIVDELCGEPPANFWVQQLGDGRKKDSILSL